MVTFLKEAARFFLHLFYYPQDMGTIIDIIQPITHHHIPIQVSVMKEKKEKISN